MMSLVIVIIGRNEALRLPSTLEAVSKANYPFVYVDSASKDTSASIAEKWTKHVVRLDGQKHSAARARNAGFKYATENFPSVEWIQFIDGDSVLFDAWLSAALSFGESDSQVGAVCGFVREKAPESSPYNRMMALEWDAQVGLIPTCNGTAMIRVAAFKDAGIFNEDLTAGEEFDFYERMRLRGWKSYRIAHNMITHDASIDTLRAWLTRSLRGGMAAHLALSRYRAGAKAFAPTPCLA